MLGFIRHIVFVLFSPRGRISRTSYWCVGLGSLFFYLPIPATGYMVNVTWPGLENSQSGLTTALVVAWWVSLHLVAYNLAVIAAKRTRDLGGPGWLGLLALAPFVGLAFGLYIRLGQKSRLATLR